MTTHRPAGTGIMHTASLAEACERPRKKPRFDGRHKRRVEPGKVILRPGSPIAELRVPPHVVERHDQSYGARITRKVGLTPFAVFRIANKLA